MDGSIRILLAEDHKVVLRGLESLLRTEADFEVVGTATDGVEALASASRLQPDVLLLDLQLPKRTGLQIIPEVRTQAPNTKIVVLTSFSDDDTVFAAIQAGALSYLLKDCSPEELMQTIRDAYQGKPTLPTDIAMKLVREIQNSADKPISQDPLTERELDVLRLVARGLSNQEIADKLVISESTVRTHVSKILDKLHLANRTQAALYALREGYTTLDG